MSIEYYCLDRSEDELRKAPGAYTKIVADVSTLQATLEGKFDFVFSKMLAEHISNAEGMHRNVFHMLKRGGHAFHFFPTLYAPPYILNLLAPEKLSEWLLEKFQPERDLGGRQGKFPAYYRWCRGPTTKQITRFSRLGFEVLEYHGFFGHGGYYGQIRPLLWMHHHLCQWLSAHPIPHLTSFSYLILRKP